MLSLIVRLLLIGGGAIASWFVSNEALNYEVIQMVAAIFIFMFMAVLAAFWPIIFAWLKSTFGAQNK